MIPEFAVILPAAGRSVRFGRDKLLEPLAGRSVIARSVEAFLGIGQVRRIVIPTFDEPGLRRALSEAGVADERIAFCSGGPSRAHSVREGASRCGDAPWLAVHDAARPLVSRGLIERTLQAAIRFGAAVPALPVALTIKQARGPLPAKVRRTLPRSELWAMQTPQVMRRCDLMTAFEKCPIPLDQVTDDVQLIEMAGGEVWLVEGEERNLKITTELDLQAAELVLTRPAAP